MDNANFATSLSSGIALPLPFHILVLGGFAILGWATNLHGLDAAGVDVISAMDLRTDGINPLPAHNTLRQSSYLFYIYRALYRICTVYAIVCFTSWLLYQSATGGNVIFADKFGYIPGITIMVVFGTLFCPYNVLHKTERRKFIQAVHRCIFPAWSSPIYFSDVVLADIFTSFAQVLGDGWLSICMLAPGNTILTPPLGEGWFKWVLPTVMSLPFAIRLRQCLMEYYHQENTLRRPLYNALKYATAFPVIYLTAAQRIMIAELIKEKGGAIINETWHGEHYLFRLWLLAAAINSLYSFWWDITNDWGLNLLKPRSIEGYHERPSPLVRLHSSTPLISRNSSESPIEIISLMDGLPERPRRPDVYGLRSTLFFPPLVYLILVALNLVLRLTWMMRVSSLIRSHASAASFCLKFAELFRRWMWVFIRVEWEIIKKEQEARVRPRADNVDVDHELITTATIE